VPWKYIPPWEEPTEKSPRVFAGERAKSFVRSPCRSNRERQRREMVLDVSNRAELNDPKGASRIRPGRERIVRPIRHPLVVVGDGLSVASDLVDVRSPPLDGGIEDVVPAASHGANEGHREKRQPRGRMVVREEIRGAGGRYEPAAVVKPGLERPGEGWRRGRRAARRGHMLDHAGPCGSIRDAEFVGDPRRWRPWSRCRDVS